MSCGEATAIAGISLLLVLAIAIVNRLGGKAATKQHDDERDAEMFKRGWDYAKYFASKKQKREVVEPGPVDELVGAANATLAANPCEDTMRTLEAAVAPFNATKPAECKNGCPPQQVCNYCQITARYTVAPKQHAVEVTEEMVDRALRGVEKARGYRDHTLTRSDMHAALLAALTGKTEVDRG